MCDFDMLDAGFLCNDFGLEPMVTVPTHGKNFLDQVDVNLYGACATGVQDSILKAKHKLVHIFPVGSKQTNNSLHVAEPRLFITVLHIISINYASFLVLTISNDETEKVDNAYMMSLNDVRNCITKYINCSQNRA